jgi:hypothetical protein
MVIMSIMNNSEVNIAPGPEEDMNALTARSISKIQGIQVTPYHLNAHEM